MCVQLARAVVLNSETGKLETASFRISKAAWLGQGEHQLVDRVSRQNQRQILPLTPYLSILAAFRTRQPIPLFVLSICHPPSPTPYIIRAGGRRPPGKRPMPIGIRRPPLAGGVGLGTRLRAPGLTLAGTVWVLPGRRPFLPGPLSPPYPTSHSPAMI